MATEEESKYELAPTFYLLSLLVSGFRNYRCLIQTQEISLHTPNPLPQGERGLHKFPPPLMGGGQGEGNDVNLFNSFAIALLPASG